MPTWGWFVVALVVVDLVVIVTWVVLRRTAKPTLASAHAVDAATQDEVFALVSARKKVEAMKLLRDRTGMPLRQAKDTVDAVSSGRTQ
ncbi:hypothetical protein [Rhodococcoides trifolii]|nr:hypothetical protein [Rhodococcus trifolii]